MVGLFVLSQGTCNREDKMNVRSIRAELRIILCCFVCILFLFSCQSENGGWSNSDLPSEPFEEDLPPHSIQFSVFSRAAQYTSQLAGEEIRIRELYIYAFDDAHNRPDFYCNQFINNGQGTVDNYRVVMGISGTGKKRFYLIANPPEYIRKQLTAECKEGLLKSMQITLHSPIFSMAELPQEPDGVSKPKNTGFPMSCCMTAFVNRGDARDKLYLSAVDADNHHPIQKIPLFRSLGKVSVVAYVKDNVHTEPLSVNQLSLFNYTRDGLFIPRWQSEEECWNLADGSWNSRLQMNLIAMSEYERQVGVDPVMLMNQPLVIPPECNSTANVLPLTSFYVCQNSYGMKMNGEMQEGMPDVQGNRTTKLTVVLSDGRISEIALPYLRRNDHLTVRLGITRNVIKVDFLKWKTSTVSPEWDDGVIVPSPVEPDENLINKRNKIVEDRRY